MTVERTLYDIFLDPGSGSAGLGADLAFFEGRRASLFKRNVPR